MSQQLSCVSQSSGHSALAVPIRHLVPRPPSAQRQLTPTPHTPRIRLARHGVAVQASAAATQLATYTPRFLRRTGTAAPWFERAVREIVKHAGEAPFLQLVHQLGSGHPLYSSFSVHASVVAAPELWQSIAKHVSHDDSPDVVILVQRVSDHAAASPQAAMDQAAAAGSTSRQPGQQQHEAAGPAPDLQRAHSTEMAERAAAACTRLVQSGLAETLISGRVGEDCCDEEEAHSSSSSAGRAQPGRQQQQQQQQAPSILPLGGSLARRAVRAAALGPPSAAAPCDQAACYWGVVVQSGQATGAEGAFLLKTVRSSSPATGCTCTHFSLTRIHTGDPLERQFVQSWLL